jgi:invasion protein IalB
MEPVTACARARDAWPFALRRRAGALVALFGAVTLSAAAAAGGDTRHLAVPDGAGLMRLGVELPTSVPARGVSAPEPRGEIHGCGKWRALARRLGETYAGMRLRRAVVERACAFSDDGGEAETVWSWPWRDGGMDPAPPPRLHATFGAWTIRCGAAGRRERCALMHAPATGPVPADGAPVDLAAVATHFVIDTIAGEQRVLWRVQLHGGMARDYVLPPLRERSAAVTFRLGARSFGEAFDWCGPAGCVMEAGPRASADLATRLWDGQPVHLLVEPPGRSARTVEIPALGFRAALGELGRLKRQEDRILATR